MDGNHSGAQLTRNVDGTHAGVDGIPSGAQPAKGIKIQLKDDPYTAQDS